MISICIPVYNYAVAQLVGELKKQIGRLRVPVEIVIVDDGSEERWKVENRKACSGINYFELPENTGRSRIRNLLVEKAAYDFLLFLDCDTLPVSDDFLEKYLEAVEQADCPVACGGIAYKSEKPPRNMQLRWKYGRARESLPVFQRKKNPWKSFSTGNFLVRRDVFEKIKFEEELTRYGHEDTLFGYQLKKEKIPVVQIDNPVYHLNIEDNGTFLEKTDVAVENLTRICTLLSFDPGFIRDVRLLKTYYDLRKKRLAGWFYIVFVLTAPFIRFLLESGRGNIRMFDFYKLGMLMRDFKENDKKMPVMPVVWQLAILHLESKTLITGVILKKAPLTPGKKRRAIRHFYTVVRSYFVSPLRLRDIRIKIAGRNLKTRTKKRGGFILEIDRVEAEEVEIFLNESDIPLHILQIYPLAFHTEACPFKIISDIDDTILVSYTARFFKRMKTLLVKTPHKRKTVGYTRQMFEHLKQYNACIYYVSRSESNLFHIITAFLVYNRLPLGMLFLTPYLNLWQLAFMKKAVGFKLKHMRWLLENSGDKKYILFGDDSQRDMDFYAQIAREYPGRIIKVYIRQTLKRRLWHQQVKWEKLKAAGVPVTYYNSFENPGFEKKEIDKLIANACGLTETVEKEEKRM